MRQRWVVHPETGKLVDADEYYAQKRTDRQGCFHVMPDIAWFISPIDGTEITSRSKLREHEKKHRVHQVGTDYKLADYDAANVRRNPLNERAVENAYRAALQKLGL